MLIIDPSHEVLAMYIDPILIELAGRTCYKSEAKSYCSAPEDHTGMPKDGSCAANGADPYSESCSGCGFHSPSKFIRMLLKRGHESVLEHSMLTVRFITNRGVSHELVRHRLAAFSQESTRYVSSMNGLVVIRPVWCEDLDCNNPSLASRTWGAAMLMAENTYLELLAEGWRPEQAREVLPNSTKTEIVVTANAREWRHIFKLRTAPAAHPEMRRIMIPLLEELKQGDARVLLEDLNIKE